MKNTLLFLTKKKQQGGVGGGAFFLNGFNMQYPLNYGSLCRTLVISNQLF